MADVKEKKMTEKKMFELLADGKITQEIVELAKKKVAKYEAERLQREEAKASKEAVVMEILKDATAPLSAKEVGERLDLDSRKVSPTLVRMAKEGKIQKVSESPNTYQI